MKSQARAVVIGGGIVGVSILYHFTKKKGWDDVVLVEKNDLTDGSTWHAAGLLPLFQMSYSVGQIHKYSVDLYQKLEAETGQEVSFHKNGNLRLATTEERMDEYRKYSGTANTIGVPYEIITPKDVQNLWPLAYTDDLVGAIYHPDDGHIAPADVTMALAKGARSGGAEIYRQTEVTDIYQKKNGEWVVKTDKGEITCEVVVSATGNYARQTAALVGLDIPVIPVEHQFLVTEEVPELVERKKEGKPELPVLRDSDHAYYMREERQGLILGPYEKGAPAWAVDGVPEGFGRELLPPDIERLEPHIEAAMQRVPCFGEVGIKDCVNGPISYTPDGNPYIGPALGLENFWFAEGQSFGITAAGGTGKVLVDWITEGDPGLDPSGFDTRRFGPHANKQYTKVKNEEAYEHVFINHFPLEERPAARPLKTPPVYERMKKRNAVFGQANGWERPNWFAPEGEKAEDIYSYRRTNFFEPVKQECLNTRRQAGIQDLTAFSKYEVTGPGAEAWLNSILANVVPKKIGKTGLAHYLMPWGGVASEFTITRTGKESFYLISGSGAEMHDWDILSRHLPSDRNSVQLRNISWDRGVLGLVGPNARRILERVTDADLSNEAFPWLSAREIVVGQAPVLALRVNFVGELGWELHHPIIYQTHIFDKLMEAGEYAFGLKPYGTRAMESMRLEKSYRMWNTDLTREYTAFESGIDRFIKLDKEEDFPGKKALIEQKKSGKIKNRMVTLSIDANDADVFGNEPIYKGDAMIGRATSGAYGHCLDTSMALAYVQPEYAEPGTGLQIEILKEMRPAKVLPECPFDPDNTRLKDKNPVEF